MHAGQIVLFRLPAGWPLVGGPITLEAVIAGAISGLAMFTILVVFAAFNAVMDHYQLLRATPGFLFQAGVVVSIAITFVPQMVLSAREIRQAQRIRGHRFRGVRDLVPLVIPLLANGLERAIQLAETMEARGFSSAVEPLSRRQALLSQSGMLAGLLGLLVGLSLLAFSPQASTAGWVLAGLGVIGLLVVLGLQGRRVHRTRYRRPRWQARDTAVVIASGFVLATMVVARLVVPETLYYSPYPPNPLLPPFQPLVGLALLLLTLTALLAPSRKTQVTSDAPQAIHNTEHGR
jgi:energy-coupling factor transport system permease protein